MSVIIKSNNVASKSFGTTKMLGTTAQAEFDKYKARVIADGGVIKDESRTKRAFKMLFDNRMYGNMNSFISGSFGAKVDGSGGITKLYAIDGVDLIGAKYGTGTLPTFSEGNAISFAANSHTDNINGAMFSSESPFIQSKFGSFGFAVRMWSSGEGTTAYASVSGLTLHDDEPNTVAIAGLYISKTARTMSFVSMKQPFSLTSSTLSETASVSYLQADLPLISVLSQQKSPYKLGFRNREQLTALTTDKPIEELQTKPFYLDFGGIYRSNVKAFAIASIVDFMCFNQATQEQVAALSDFSA